MILVAAIAAMLGAGPANEAGGTLLCYMTPVGGLWQVLVRNLDGTGRKILTKSPFDKKDPVFHPDRKRVFFSGTNHGAFWVDIATAQEHPIKQAMEGARGIRFSADGGKVLYYRARTDANDQSEIWMADSAFRSPVQIIARPGLQRYPDGDSALSGIVYLSGRAATGHDIWYYRIRDSSQVRITNDMATESAPAISPSGRKVAFASAPLGLYAVYVTALADPAPKPIQLPRYTVLDLDWIDEDRLICTVMEGGREPQLGVLATATNEFTKLEWEETRGIRCPSVLRRP